ncbi:putative lipoprotein [Hartmannibacter diazotrophicus]|uniref:Putative lipoprotein n=1 Tax=Hartmannibacter diazotrophicus TaxID=1482074 RepID=A0A2C9D0D6_9HYPH|nr:penicillin-binding protein activator [Hartmannibacter diazotrophicus]SON53628.1 putative lipoprotein [Hartmannibacter diazotrophicus]
MAGVGALLAGCSQQLSGGLGPGTGTSGAVLDPNLPPPTGNTIGTGSVRVALLVPQSATGAASTIATALRNSAAMALQDFAGADVTILVKDSAGTAEGAAAATQAALSEGAQLIIGPFFAAEVRGAAPVAKGAQVPVIAFSSDPGVAEPGVYIMGFLIGDEMQQMVAKSAALGRNSVAAMISNSAAGNLAEASLRSHATRYGISIVAVERFEPNAGDISAKAASLAGNKARIQSIFLPDGGQLAIQAAGALTSVGLSPSEVTYLGSGQWNDAAVFGSTALAGGLFPAPEIDRFNAFAARYRTSFGVEPYPKATLAYDAVLLACGLVKQVPGPRRFDPGILANRQGFISSVNGLFRFNTNGTNDRALAIYQVTGGAPQLVDAAARSFAGS